MVQSSRTWRAIVMTVAFGCAGCASMNGAPTPDDLDAAIRAERRLPGFGSTAGGPFPPDVNLADGLTQGGGRRHRPLEQSGLLRNPIFSLLFPSGPKQLEWTLQFPFEALAASRRVSPPHSSTRRRSASGSSGTR